MKGAHTALLEVGQSLLVKCHPIYLVAYRLVAVVYLVPVKSTLPFRLTYHPIYPGSESTYPSIKFTYMTGLQFLVFIQQSLIYFLQRFFICKSFAPFELHLVIVVITRDDL